MKRLTILPAALLLGIVPARSQSLDRLWDEANTAYINADYQAAARWLLTESHPELIDEWLTAEQAETLKAAL